MNRSRIQYHPLFSYLSAPALAVLSFSSTGLAQVIPIAPSATIDAAQIQPVSTEAADLGEAIAPTFPSEITPSSEFLPTAIEAVPIQEGAQLEILDESLTILESTPVASTSPLSFSSRALPALDAAQPELLAQSSTPSDPPLPADPATSNSTVDGGYDPNANLRIPLNLAEGKPIQQVYIYLRNPTGDSDRDEGFQQDIANAFGNQAGGNFSPRFAELGVNQVHQLPFVEAAEYRVYESDLPGSVIVAVLVTLQPEGVPPTSQAQEPTGILVTGNADDFPVLYESDRAVLRMIWNGGVGLFSDTPWFSNSENFLAGPYLPSGTVTWPEFNLETGIAGITQLGDAPLYVYGAATYTISASLAPDIFQPGSRAYGAVEQLYGGALVAAPGSPVSFNLSAGRQKFQLNQGFLFSQFAGAVNALERGASYLNPRTAYDMTVLANLRFGDFRLQGFFLEPNELPIADTGTQYLGASLSYNNNRNVEASLSYITVPNSDTLYLLPNGETATRQGLQVINPQIRLSSLFGVDGLWAAGEYAYEFSDELDMSAHGGYVWLGYTAQDVSWRPSISYRFAGFSGDDPDTSTYERFDPLQAGGLSDWLQGISLGKVYNNSNGFSHRVSLSVQPSSDLSIALDYYYRYADQLNNLGGSRPLQTLQSRDIGHEVQLVTRYFISQNFMLQGLAGIAFPGAAIRRAVSEDTDPWITLQLSLFMFF